MMKLQWWWIASGLVVAVSNASAPAQQATPELKRPKLSWTTDLTKMKIPDAPVSGTIHGKDFVMDQAKLENGTLTIRRGKEFWPEAAVVVSLFLKEGETVAGKTYRVGGAGARPFISPHVRIKWAQKAGAPPDTQAFTDGYAMVLELGRSKGGQLPGRLYVCVPDESKSVVAGTFSVEVFDATHPMATNTLISGEVAIKKGAGERKLEMCCMGMNQNGEMEYPSATLYLKEGISSTDPECRPRETRLTWDKTRQVGRHEHTNRPPGWYLLYLQGHQREEPEDGVRYTLCEGYYDWKWVELKDKNSKVVVGLSVDPAALGDVEISIPNSPKKSKVTYLPLHPEGGFPWPEAHWSLSGTTGVKVHDGKAVVRWLREGKYQFALVADGRNAEPLMIAEANVTRGQTTKIELVPAKASGISPRPATQPAPSRPGR